MEPLRDKKIISNHEKLLDYSRLNIPFWNDTLTLPKNTGQHQKSILDLQNKFKFALVVTKISDLIFISDQTNFKQLLLYLPFISDNYQIYHCSGLLIEEYLHLNDHNGVLSESNEATKQLIEVLEAATKQSASDIHFENLSSGRQIRMRVNGRLKFFQLDSTIGDNLIYKIKLMSGMDIAVSRTPQDGHFSYSNIQGEKFDLRTSTVPGIFGEKIVIRLLPAKPVKLAMDQLGFSESFISAVRKVLVKKSGMILFTGPTGSGKTTSLYSILNELISESLNILTIEDPVEYRIDAITQVAVNKLAGVTFSTALRSFLRQDPDVILVGEIRDSDTAKIACRAAQTGHLVLSTLHCNDVFEAFQRLKGLDVGMDDIASSLSLVVSQRLLNRSCHCNADEIVCEKCRGTGVFGRIPVLEFLIVDQEIRQLLQLQNNPVQVKSLAEKKGYKNLMENARELADLNIIRLSELDTMA